MDKGAELYFHHVGLFGLLEAALYRFARCHDAAGAGEGFFFGEVGHLPCMYSEAVNLDFCFFPYHDAGAFRGKLPGIYVAEVVRFGFTSCMVFRVNGVTLSLHVIEVIFSLDGFLLISRWLEFYYFWFDDGTCSYRNVSATVVDVGP